MNKVFFGTFILLFWAASAYAGWYVATYEFPWWLGLLIVVLIALVVLDRPKR